MDGQRLSGALSDSLAQGWRGILRRPSVQRLARRLESYSFAVALEQVAIHEGLRAATGVAIMVAAAVWLDWSSLTWAAFGAFWVCLADPGGTDRLRFRLMSLFAAAGTISAFIASATAGISPFLGAVALIPLVFVPSLSALYGLEAARVGTLVCVVAVVAVAFPNPPGAALQLAGLFLLGCLWAMILCMLIWRIERYGPARRAIVAALARLSSMIVDLLALDHTGRSVPDWDTFNAEHRRSIRATLERTRSIVAALETSERRYRVEIDIADRVFAALIAIGHALAERGAAFDVRSERDLLHRLLLLLAEAQHQSAQRYPNPTLLAAEAMSLEHESAAVTNVIGRGIEAATQALRELPGAWQEGAERLNDRLQLIEPDATCSREKITRVVLSHAARVAVAVLISYGLSSSLNLRFSYWATMATVVVVQPEVASIWQRSIERMLGSIAGGLLAALLMFVLPTKLALLALIFPLAAATIAFRLVSYTIFVLFVTSLFVLVTELLQPVPGVAFTRVLDNVVGSVVGVTASLRLWRGRGPMRTGEVLADAVTANLAYAAQVVAGGGTAAERDTVRRRAGVASGAAERMQHRMRLEGQSRRAHLAEMADLLDALRRLAGAAAVSSLTGHHADPVRAAALLRQGAVLADAIEQPAAATPPEVLSGERPDDIDRAIRGVAATAADYVTACHARSAAGCW